LRQPHFLFIYFLTDSNLKDAAAANLSVSVPARYIHSPASVISLDDFYSVKSLVKSFLHSLKPALEEGEENND